MKASLPDQIISVLLIEENEIQRKLITDMLATIPDIHFAVTCKDKLDGALNYLVDHSSDVILMDLISTNSRAFDAFIEVHSKTTDVPIIVVASDDDENIALKAIQCGAQDYLVRGNFDAVLIARSIRYAIERQRMLTELKFALASEKVLMEELDRKNKELVELSITDGLTGLYNHRFIQERFDFEFKRAKRYGAPLSCMLIDIDHFKSVNDTYGHQFGDLVLTEIADLIKKGSREVDICGRYGGEEFMVVASVNADDAMLYATKLHKSIDEYEFTNGENSIHVTVSIGVVDYHNEVKTKQELIDRADSALYWAKRDGRNLIRLWKNVEGDDAKESLDQLGISGLKSEFMRLSHDIRATYMESTNALVRAIDAKDHYTQEHSKGVSSYAVQVAKALRLPEKETEIIKYAGLLHDIGKIGISHEILTKKERLKSEEFDILKKHPVIGVSILKDVKFLEKEIPIILHHHEHFDGRGYPHGLKGREIPLGARILAVVDAWDAMTTDREYRRRLSTEEAINELKRFSGTQFDNEIVDAFLALFEKGFDGFSKKCSKK
ncbi:MAG: diguanylate cyclase [Chitinivibrionales bacterium]|nr:diguanylate cyclase [Chitinivibrionales bacterium]